MGEQLIMLLLFLTFYGGLGFFLVVVIVMLLRYKNLYNFVKKGFSDLGSKIEHEHQLMIKMEKTKGMDIYEQCPVCGKIKVEKNPFDSLSELEPETIGIKFPSFQQLRRGFKNTKTSDDNLPHDTLVKS